MNHGAPASPRFHAMDGLRATMMMLGIVIHATVSYTTVPMGSAWPFKDISTHPAFDFITFFIHIFRMPIFFVMAGFFAALLYWRRGPRNLVVNRIKRILIPLAIGWTILFPAVIAAFRYAFSVQMGRLELFSLDVRMSLIHLWFLYDLLFFYAAALVIVPIARRLSEARLHSLSCAFRRAVGSRWRPCLFALPTFATLYPMRSGVLDTSTSFIPDPKTLAAYGIFFVFGWIFYSHADLLSTFRKDAGKQIIFALLLFPLNLMAVSQVIRTSSQPAPLFHFLAALTGSLLIWLLVFGISGVFARYLDRPSERMRYLVDSSYWIYLVHLPLIIFLQGTLAGFSFSAWIKVSLVMAISIPILILSYHYCVRATLIGEVLNGRRYPRQMPSFGLGPLLRNSNRP